MNTKNKLITVFLVILIVTLFYHNIYIMNQLNKQKEMNVLLLEEIENQYIPHSSFLCYLQKELEVIKKFEKFKNSLFSNKINKPLLIYRYTNSICEGCIQEDLNNLEIFLSDIGKESILVLPSIEDTRENKIFLHNKLGKFNYKNIPLNAFEMPLDCDNKVEQRFFILISKDGEIISIFFSLSSHSHYTKEFFQHIKKYIN